MLEFIQSDDSKDCAGLRRRDFIRAGSLSLGGLSLATLMGVRANAARRNLASAGNVFITEAMGTLAKIAIACCGMRSLHLMNLRKFALISSRDNKAADRSGAR